jgi:hypothetical protein
VTKVILVFLVLTDKMEHKVSPESKVSKENPVFQVPMVRMALPVPVIQLFSKDLMQLTQALQNSDPTLQAILRESSPLSRVQRTLQRVRRLSPKKVQTLLLPGQRIGS